jgi:(3S)-malyl-CoA thioesterase
MDISRLRLCRSLLFLPASNPRAIAKARSLSPDMVILDLEDSVRPEDKEEARRAAAAACREGFPNSLVAIRINVQGSPWFGRDTLAVRDSKADFVILPKVEQPKQARDAGGLAMKPVLAMIETPLGVLGTATIAPAAAGLIAGVNDLAAQLRIPPGAGRSGLSYALQRIVLGARAAGSAVFDGVYNALDDAKGLEAECAEGRAFGFDGKTLIHPGQIDIANKVFSPSPTEVEAAVRLIAAAGGGAERFEGRMIEAMHVDQAHAVLAKARHDS